MTITDAITYLRGLHDGATKGPWDVTHIYDDEEVITGLQTEWKPNYVANAIGSIDAALIAVSRNVLPELLAVVEAAVEVREAFCKIHEDVHGQRAVPPQMLPLLQALTALAAAVEREASPPATPPPSILLEQKDK